MLKDLQFITNISVAGEKPINMSENCSSFKLKSYYIIQMITGEREIYNPKENKINRINPKNT